LPPTSLSHFSTSGGLCAAARFVPLAAQRPEGPTLAKEGRREGGKPDSGVRRLPQKIALRNAALGEIAARVGDKGLAVMTAKTHRLIPAFEAVAER